METLDEDVSISKAFTPTAPQHRVIIGADGHPEQAKPELGGEGSALLEDEQLFLQEAVRRVLATLPKMQHFAQATLELDLALLPKSALEVLSDPLLKRASFSHLSHEMRDFVGDLAHERKGKGKVGPNREKVLEEARNEYLKRETLHELWEAHELQKQMAPYLLQLA